MTLKALRQMTPVRDRACEAVAPYPKRNPQRPGFQPYLATTLDELRRSCCKHGEVMVQDTILGAVERWLRREWDRAPLSHPIAVADVAVSLCRENTRARLGYPTKDRRPLPDTLSKMTAESQGEARRVTAQTISDWERAGHPYFGPNEIKREHRYYLQTMKGKRP